MTVIAESWWQVNGGKEVPDSWTLSCSTWVTSIARKKGGSRKSVNNIQATSQ